MPSGSRTTARITSPALTLHAGFIAFRFHCFKIKGMYTIEISANDNVFVLTGAGISAESGIPTFRSGDGLWDGHKVSDVCTPQAWENDPWKVWKFYSDRRAVAAAAQPNDGHKVLADLERKMGDRMFVCTQNVDNLHEAAGSKNVHHMHGDLFMSRCEHDCSPPVADRSIYKTLSEVPRCHCGGRFRPYITFFGEIPMGLEIIDQKLKDATVLVVIGTSGTVYPAAGLAQAATQNGVRTIYVGLENPLNARQFSEVYLASASSLMFDIRD
jgi:NAD-dependent deacetylase